MDWTGNPLAALYFSCCNKANCDGTVWFLHKMNYYTFWRKQINLQNKKISEIIVELIRKKTDIEFPALYTPYYVDLRMSSQNSFFMVWGTREEALEKMFEEDRYYMNYLEKDEGARTYGYASQQAILFKVHIPADRKQHLLRELNMVGINEKSLFPGLDGIGRYVERRYRFDYNEAVEFF